MSRRLVHHRLGIAEPKAVALGEAEVDAGNPRRVRLGAGDLAAGRLLELEVAAGVVGMVVGREDPVELPAAGAQPVEHRAGHRRVDGAGHPGLGLMDQIDVVVAEHGICSILSCAIASLHNHF